jgi:putative DNA primase/helicase
MQEQALKELPVKMTLEEKTANARAVTARCVAALPEPAVRQAITPTTRSTGAGRSITHEPPSAAIVAEMLSFIPPPPDGPDGYNLWLHLVSAVAATLSPGEALEVLLAWSPDRKPGETEDKIRNRLTQVGTGTLVFHAKAGGWRGTPPGTRSLKVTRENEFGDEEYVYLAPQPFPRPRLRDVLPYRKELLPPDLRDWIGDLVMRNDYQEDFLVVGALCSLGICLGSKVAVYPKRHDDWHEHANLWGMVVGRPGTMKSPAMNAAMAPLRSVAARWTEAHMKATTEFQEKAAYAEIEHKSAMKAIQKLSDKGERFELPEKSTEAPPRARRLTTSDVTKEKLASLMKENPAGLMAEFDELMGLFAAIENDAGLKEFLLKCWSGKSGHHVDRVIRGSEYVPRACASVLGGIQPGRLRPLVAAGLDGGAGSDGFLARFQLLAYPDPPTGKFTLVDQWPDHDAKKRAQAVFDALADMDGLDFPNQNGCDTPGLRFDDDAQQLFNGWLCDLVDRERSEKEPDAMLELLAKTRKLVPALALLLQLGRDPRSTSIDVEALENAIELSHIAESHQRRLHDCASEDVHVAHLIWGKLLEGKLDAKGFSIRDILRHGWTGLTDAAAVKEAVASLQDRYWICGLEWKPAGGAGGRPSTRFRVNPATQEVQFFA